MNDIIYFDNASTTPLKEEVLNAMMPYLTKNFGNANSVHSVGRNAVSGLDKARETVAKIINANFDEVYFTSGGTESDNLALRGSYLTRGNKNNLIISTIEHAAVTNTAKSLEKQGAKLLTVSPNEKGILSVSDYLNLDTQNAFLVSMMLANNEIGTIEPVKELCKACNERGIITFSDAVQGIVSLDIDVKDLGVSMLSFSAHKFGGPKGVGVLYVKNGTKLSPIISGGHQERSKRGGTSNVAGAVGLAKALSLSRENLEKDRLYVLNLREHFINRVLSEIPNTHLNGDRENRLVNNANILFSGINGEKLLYQLDLKGVCASLGAACSAGTIEPSVVLKEIGLSDIQAKSSIRFTFSTNNTIEEVDRVVEILKEEIKK